MTDTAIADPWQAPFARFKQYGKELNDLIDLTVRGVRGVQTLVEIREVTRDYRKDEGQDSDGTDQSAALAALAEQQEKKGFPLLYGHAMVSLWGSLEVLVGDLAVAWLGLHPELLSGSTFSKVSVPVRALAETHDEDVAAIVLAEATRQAKVETRVGVSQLEAPLALVGLDGAVGAKVRDGVFYLQQFRHALVHRGGVADKRVVEACPAFGLAVGDRLPVGAGLYWQFWLAANLYAVTVKDRCLVAKGRAPFKVAEPNGFGEFVDAASPQRRRDGREQDPPNS